MIEFLNYCGLRYIVNKSSSRPFETRRRHEKNHVRAVPRDKVARGLGGANEQLSSQF